MRFLFPYILGQIVLTPEFWINFDIFFLRFAYCFVINYFVQSILLLCAELQKKALVRDQRLVVETRKGELRVEVKATVAEDVAEGEGKTKPFSFILSLLSDQWEGDLHQVTFILILFHIIISIVSLKSIEFFES